MPDPRSLLRHFGHRFRRHVRGLWQSRGGGFYGFVAVLMFLFILAVSIVWTRILRGREVELT